MFAVSFIPQTTPCRFRCRFRSHLSIFSSLQHRHCCYSRPPLAFPFLSQIGSLKTQIDMAARETDIGLAEPKTAGINPFEEALDALSSLITKRSRADTKNKGDRFDLLFDYLKILDLEDEISEMKVIHVAGTKGKGSTCAFTESILHNYGLRTGLFTSPHLINVRERFRLDGVDIREDKFLTYFWWCYNRLKERTDEETPMPTYFRFLALLAFKIFAAEKVDVAILEVGLGGKFDATNVVEKPVVCGISSLGYDHMEILGDTLGKIAGEKAGIFKRGVQAITVPQPDEAMRVLQEKASDLDVNLQVAQPLNEEVLKGQKLALDGEHQYLNAALAVSLASAFLHQTPCLNQMITLPEQFIKGLANARLQGRAQVISDEYIESGTEGDVMFYLDGAHSPESMEACAKWFSLAVKGDKQSDSMRSPRGQEPGQSCQQILLFNCMSVRDPHLLLPHLRNTCANYGVDFKKALFVPNMSVYHKVGTHGLPENDSEVDLSWQIQLQQVWESLVEGEDGGKSVENSEKSMVFSSLPLAIQWLRQSIHHNVRLQVLVTGSLHLVGDVLRLVRK